VDSALKPWTDGFMPKVKYKPREQGVPVDKSNKSSWEVVEWINSKPRHKAQGGAARFASLWLYEIYDEYIDLLGGLN